MDMTTGDFEVSYLHKHLVPETSCVLYGRMVKTLCFKVISKCVKCHWLYYEGRIHKPMWGSQLRGENVDAMGKAGQYAETQLPNTITPKKWKKPHKFSWQMK